MACSKPHGNPSAIFAAADAIDRYAAGTIIGITDRLSDRELQWTGAVASQVTEVARQLDNYLGVYSGQLHDYAAQLRSYAAELKKAQSCTIAEILTWIFIVVFVVVEIIVGIFSGGVLNSMLTVAFAGVIEAIAEIGSTVAETVGLAVEIGGTIGRVAANISKAIPSVSRTIGQVGRFTVDRTGELFRDVAEDFVTKLTASADPRSGGLREQYSAADAAFVANFLPVGEIVGLAKRGGSALIGDIRKFGDDLTLPNVSHTEKMLVADSGHSLTPRDGVTPPAGNETEPQPAGTHQQAPASLPPQAALEQPPAASVTNAPPPPINQPITHASADSPLPAANEQPASTPIGPMAGGTDTFLPGEDFRWLDELLAQQQSLIGDDPLWLDDFLAQEQHAGSIIPTPVEHSLEQDLYWPFSPLSQDRPEHLTTENPAGSQVESPPHTREPGQFTGGNVPSNPTSLTTAGKPFSGIDAEDPVAWAMRREPVLRLTATGYNDAQIAEILGTDTTAVARERTNALQQLLDRGVTDPSTRLSSTGADYYAWVQERLSDGLTIEQIAASLNVDPIEIARVRTTVPAIHQTTPLHAPTTAGRVLASPEPVPVGAPPVAPALTAEERAERLAAHRRAQALLATGPGPINVGLSSPQQAITLRLTAEGLTVDEISTLTFTSAVTHRQYLSQGLALTVGQRELLGAFAREYRLSDEVIEHGANLEHAAALPYLQRSVIERLAELPPHAPRRDVRAVYQALEEELGLPSRYLATLERKAHQHLGLTGTIEESRSYIRSLFDNAPPLYFPADDPLHGPVPGVTESQRMALILARENLTDNEIAEAMNLAKAQDTFNASLVRGLLRNGQNQLAGAGIVLPQQLTRAGQLTRLELPPFQQYLVRRIRAGASPQAIAEELSIPRELLTALAENARQLLNAEDTRELEHLFPGLSPAPTIRVRPPAAANPPAQAAANPPTQAAANPRGSEPAPQWFAVPRQGPIEAPRLSPLLDPEQNTILVLRAWRYSSREISTIMHIPLDSVSAGEMAGLERLLLLRPHDPASTLEGARSELVRMVEGWDPRLPVPQARRVSPPTAQKADDIAREILATQARTGGLTAVIPATTRHASSRYQHQFTLNWLTPTLLREGMPIAEMARVGGATVPQVTVSLHMGLRELILERGQLGRFAANAYMPSFELYQFAQGASIAERVADLPLLQQRIVRMRAAGADDARIATDLDLSVEIVTALEALAHQHLGLAPRYVSYAPTAAVRRILANIL